MEFALNTPPDVADWLRKQLTAIPEHPVLRALATDERMLALWAEFGQWEPRARIVQLAVYFSTPRMLSALKKPPQDREFLAFPEHLLAAAAEDFAVLLEFWPESAAQFWEEPIKTLIERLRSFATAAFERGKARQSAYDYIPEPSRRGPGNRTQLAFREALSRVLLRICEEHPLPTEAQDRIISTITSVVFPKWPADPEAVRRQRLRRDRKQKTEDN